MKTIGLIGGMSWESTVTYYQIINETIKAELGGLHSAKLLLLQRGFRRDRAGVRQMANGTRVRISCLQLHKALKKPALT